MINVTKTYFPDLEEYIDKLKRIWSNEWLTNRGELVRELEDKLKAFLNVEEITVMSNGTIPIQIALKLLGGKGEVITTPFSYIATTSSIIWENCTPVYVDIDEEYLTIDESKIEAAITDRTTAILATHVFGNPCNVHAIQQIAEKHNLKVIYDGAHAFGVNYEGESIFNFGDVSTCSFHATKIFHTGEGGAVFCKNKELMSKLFYSHNFGHNGPEDFFGLGINGKISELHGAMGLAVLEKMEFILNQRKIVVEKYDSMLDFRYYDKIKLRKNTEWNYSYYPVIFKSEADLLRVQMILNAHDVFPRRYFYPSLNTIKFVGAKKMPISESISSRILCLPLSVELLDSDILRVVDLIHGSFR
jgi:dTDP-4-amino-4,6-dideoxygalactose transaminase